LAIRQIHLFVNQPITALGKQMLYQITQDNAHTVADENYGCQTVEKQQESLNIQNKLDILL